VRLDKSAAFRVIFETHLYYSYTTTTTTTTAAAAAAAAAAVASTCSFSDINNYNFYSRTMADNKTSTKIKFNANYIDSHTLAHYAT
jgi:hypothetical protein